MKKRKNPWKKISRKTVYKNPWIEVFEDTVIRPDKKRGIYGVVKPTTCLTIVPVTKHQEIYLVGQWRYTVGKYSWEIPSGGMEPGEKNPRMAALRELKEETGLHAKKLTLLGHFYLANGIVNQNCIVYMATELTKATDIKKDPTEMLDLTKKSFSDIAALIKSNKITDDVTIAAYYKTILFLKV